MKRYYVTMLWEDPPQGGSYGAIVEADSDEEAVTKVKQAMAEVRAFDMGDEMAKPEYWLEEYGSDWKVVDCWDVDKFIEENKK